MSESRLRKEKGKEWLETDGLGGFAMGTVSGVRTRRYHGYLVSALAPPSQRQMILKGVDAHFERDGVRTPLSTQEYHDGTLAPSGWDHLRKFECSPWPRWVYGVDRETRVELELFLTRGEGVLALAWTLFTGGAGGVIEMRPFVSGRPLHALQAEYPVAVDAKQRGELSVLDLGEGVGRVRFHSNAAYVHQPTWYRRFLYDEERERGFDHEEDLLNPGVWCARITPGQPVVLLVDRDSASPPVTESALDRYEVVRTREAGRRKSAANRVHRAAEDYVVVRGSGKSLIAGYPWFGDWGRDAFIALRGLGIAREQWGLVESILLAWAPAVDRGLVPNRFPDANESPEYNSVDATLWYALVIAEYLNEASVRPAVRRTLIETVEQIVAALEAGTRYGIEVDESDGLLACGEPGVQLTWMDARAHGTEVTPRIGKPVEVQALWINVLAAFADVIPGARGRGAQALASARVRFPQPNRSALFDVIDHNHRPGETNDQMRPNQVFAVGGLPVSLMEPELCARVVATVEEELWTPRGLRSLSPGDPAYRGRYVGGPDDRDAAYHQGTVWPWLLGPFVEAWLKVQGWSHDARAAAQARFLDPIAGDLEVAGLGHLSEIADGDPPHTPRGAPFQAWSLGEYVRLRALVARDRPPEVPVVTAN